MFVFFPVSVWHDISRRNNQIHLKIGTNAFVSCEISCIVSDVHWPNSAYIGMPKGISIDFSLQWEFLKTSFDIITYYYISYFT